MQSPTTRVVSNEGSDVSLNTLPDVTFLDFKDAYQQAVDALPLLRSNLATGQSLVIYRVSNSTKDLKGTVNLSRQVNVPSNGEEFYAPAIKGTGRVHYEIYAVPTALLSTSKPPSEPELSSAVGKVREETLKKKVAGNPQPAGPNVVGPAPKS
jgi:hypothetical protein